MAQDIRTSTHVSQEFKLSTLSWGAIFAGVFITLLTYMILMSLGVAVGGSTVQDVIRGQDGAQGWGWGAGLWLIAATLVSLFVGGFAAARVSGPISVRVGRIQGGVITALFFGLLLTQVGGAIGSMGKGVGNVVSTLGGAAGDLSKYPEVQDTINRAIGDLDLKASPETVVQGLAVRLIRGDVESAKSYLAMQSDLTVAETEERLNSLRQDMNTALTRAGEDTAQAAAIAGWTLFGALMLGTLSAIFGGARGARPPRRDQSPEAVRETRVA